MITSIEKQCGDFFGWRSCFPTRVLSKANSNSQQMLPNERLGEGQRGAPGAWGGLEGRQGAQAVLQGEPGVCEAHKGL